jgi:hypothetical protein
MGYISVTVGYSSVTATATTTTPTTTAHDRIPVNVTAVPRACPDDRNLVVCFGCSHIRLRRVTKLQSYIVAETEVLDDVVSYEPGHDIALEYVLVYIDEQFHLAFVDPRGNNFANRDALVLDLDRKSVHDLPLNSCIYVTFSEKQAVVPSLFAGRVCHTWQSEQVGGGGGGQEQQQQHAVGSLLLLLLLLLLGWWQTRELQGNLRGTSWELTPYQHEQRSGRHTKQVSIVSKLI